MKLNIEKLRSIILEVKEEMYQQKNSSMLLEFPEEYVVIDKEHLQTLTEENESRATEKS